MEDSIADIYSVASHGGRMLRTADYFLSGFIQTDDVPLRRFLLKVSLWLCMSLYLLKL